MDAPTTAAGRSRGGDAPRSAHLAGHRALPPGPRRGRRARPPRPSPAGRSADHLRGLSLCRPAGSSFAGRVVSSSDPSGFASLGRSPPWSMSRTFIAIGPQAPLYAIAPEAIPTGGTVRVLLIRWSRVRVPTASLASPYFIRACVVYGKRHFAGPNHFSQNSHKSPLRGLTMDAEESDRGPNEARADVRGAECGRLEPRWPIHSVTRTSRCQNGRPFPSAPRESEPPGSPSAQWLPAEPPPA